MATKKDFEAALKRLEESVDLLESGDLPLEQALKVFSAGVKEAEICRKSLREAELKVEQLLQKNDGTWQKEPLNDD